MYIIDLGQGSTTIIPANTPTGHLQEAQQNFSGNLIIGEDLMQIGIGEPV